MQTSLTTDVLKAIHGCKKADEFTDLTIICGEQEFHCHKVIMGAQSSYFKAACSQSSHEALKSRLEFSEEDPCHVNIMLEFFYTQTYDLNKSLCIPFEKSFKNKYLETHIALYVLGFKYAAPTFCQYAASCFRRLLLSNRAWDEAKFVLKCIPLIYASTAENDRVLRDIVVKEVSFWSKSIARSRGDKKSLVQLMHQIKQFREDMTLCFLEHNPWTRRNKRFTTCTEIQP